MDVYTKIYIGGRWVSPQGGTTANTINPATEKCGGRISLPPPRMLTSPVCESRDNRQPYFLHNFLPRLHGEGREFEANMSAISVSTPVPAKAPTWAAVMRRVTNYLVVDFAAGRGL